MEEAIFAVGVAMAVAVAIAAAADFVGSRLLPERWRHYTAAIGFAAGCGAGILLARPWSELWPTRHFHWPIYLALAAGLLGPYCVARQRHWRVGLPLAALACVAAAFLLTPGSSKAPSRWVLMALLAAYLALLAAAWEPLTRRVSAPELLGLSTLSAVVSAALITFQVSSTYGAGAAIAAGALSGCAIASLVSPDRHRHSAGGLWLSYAVVVGGWSFIGCQGSRPPMWILTALPLSPLMLWCFAWGPLARLEGRGAVAARASMVTAFLGFAAAWAALTV